MLDEGEIVLLNPCCQIIQLRHKPADGRVSAIIPERTNDNKGYLRIKWNKCRILMPYNSKNKHFLLLGFDFIPFRIEQINMI